jgi:hypothetical protein
VVLTSFSTPRTQYRAFSLYLPSHIPAQRGAPGLSLETWENANLNLVILSDERSEESKNLRLLFVTVEAGYFATTALAPPASRPGRLRFGEPLQFPQRGDGP